jgi:DNA mismatch endonuclease (patch repair protein)
MSRVKSSGSVIERKLGKAMWAAGIRYRKQYRRLVGRPDFAVVWAKVAIFCDSSFWHGRGWPKSAEQIKSNRGFWLKKIEGNIARDKAVNRSLGDLGWKVVRFWDSDILGNVDKCVTKVNKVLDKRRPNEKNFGKGNSG